jgi:S1-C subfamily serine protease
LIKGDIVVTNAHVTATCNETNLVGVSTSSEQIHFSLVIKDQDRDLALLVPAKPISGGFNLATTDSVTPGTQVSTWGYPFYYNGISPLLSVGYVSGYRVVSAGGKNVKHLVINGAINHGNSGGALLPAGRTDVIGVVVATYHFYPPEVKQIIDALSNQANGFQVGRVRQPDGTQKSISEAQLTSMVLEEFYEKTQVMIGEAIAVSELKNMIKDHAQELPKTPSTGKLPH